MASMKKVFLAVVGFAALSPPASAQSISVTVNEEPLSFAKQGPVQAPDGTILVPRGGDERTGFGGPEWCTGTSPHAG